MDFLWFVLIFAVVGAAAWWISKGRKRPDAVDVTEKPAGGSGGGSTRKSSRDEKIDPGKKE